MATRTILRSALVFFATLLLSAAGHAQLFRAYLAPTGSDANPCTLPAPCRLLPAALAAVASGGEIWMLDSANYNTGPVNITKSVTILAVPGALGSVLAIGGNAIDITTAGVAVVLRNLVIVPLPGGGGNDGVHMTAGASLTVEDCVVANLPQSGLYVSTPAIVRVTDTTIRDNGASGLFLQNGARATVTRATISANPSYGVLVFGVAPGTTTTADIGDSTLDLNGYGVYAYSVDATGVVKASVRDSRIVANSTGVSARSTGGGALTLSASNNNISNNGTGLKADTGSKVWASGNTVSDNTTGLLNNGGTFESASNNAVRNNGTNKTGTISTIVTE
jgi:hypothetical protein